MVPGEVLSRRPPMLPATAPPSLLQLAEAAEAEAGGGDNHVTLLQLGEGIAMPLHLGDAAARRAAASPRAQSPSASAATEGAVPPLPLPLPGVAVEYCVFRHGDGGVV